MKLDVFGKKIEVVKQHGHWVDFSLGNEGKKRPAEEIHIPSDVSEHQVTGYIADLCHEWATPCNNAVTVIDE